jgi:hypothetical protein
MGSSQRSRVGAHAPDLRRCEAWRYLATGTGWSQVTSAEHHPGRFLRFAFDALLASPGGQTAAERCAADTVHCPLGAKGVT